jgi:hypothetical protein
MMIIPSIRVIQNKRFQNALEYEVAIRTIMGFYTHLFLQPDNYIICICPHCQKRFTCLGNETCIFCGQPFGLTPAEARHIGLSSRKLPNSSYTRLVH